MEKYVENYVSFSDAGMTAKQLHFTMFRCQLKWVNTKGGILPKY